MVTKTFMLCECICPCLEWISHGLKWISGRCRYIETDTEYLYVSAQTDFVKQSGFCFRNQKAALWQTTSLTQAVRLQWLDTSDCTSGVLHDEFMCYLCFFFFSFPLTTRIFSPGSLASSKPSCTWRGIHRLKGCKGLNEVHRPPCYALCRPSRVRKHEKWPW